MRYDGEDENMYVRTVVTVEVLGNDEVDFSSLAELHDMITTGDYSGNWTTEATEITKAEVEKRLVAQGSDPNFLTDDESDLRDDIEYLINLIGEEASEEVLQEMEKFLVKYGFKGGEG